VETKEIVHALENHIEWLEQIKQMEEDKFFSPLAPGKWSIAAIVSHFKSWDEIVLNNRIHSLTSEDFDTEKVNKGAEEYAHSGISKEDLIDEVISYRKNFIEELKKLTEEDWNRNLQIGGKPYPLKSYLAGLADHDEHHRKQIKL
jgi:uncharacterized damage-inducible protein DinB